MATKPNPQYAILELPTMTALPLEHALKIFELMAEAEQVSYSYSDQSYKRTKYRTEPTIKYMSLSQYAAMQLTDAD